MDKCKHQIPWDKGCPDCHAQHKGITDLAFPVAADFPPTGGSSNYYDLPPNCKTLQDVIEGYEKISGRKMEWSQCNIFKASYRWHMKPDLRYNLEKIEWFCKDKLERIEETGDERS